LSFMVALLGVREVLRGAICVWEKKVCFVFLAGLFPAKFSWLLLELSEDC
jgi:hypothetical protein